MFPLVYWTLTFRYNSLVSCTNKNGNNYLGNVISFEGELDIENKLNNFLKITDILNNVFRPQKTIKKRRIKLYNILALPVVLYGSETGLLNQVTPEE